MISHQHDSINSSRRDHPSPWRIADRLHISYRGDISLWYNNVESLAAPAAWNDQIKLLNFPNSVWWVMNPSGSAARSSFTKDKLIVFRWFSIWLADWWTVSCTWIRKELKIAKLKYAQIFVPPCRTKWSTAYLYVIGIWKDIKTE